MHYLITGHTGFKGSWLSLVLKSLGHTVSGISLKAESDSLYIQSGLSNLFEIDKVVDIRERKELNSAISEIEADILIHFAAQPLVRESYDNPLGTHETNILGTLNVLDSTRLIATLKASLIITTDKVYKNTSSLHGYTEESPLGGLDPYSASKAAADLVTQSWVSSFMKTPVGIARAGNVIGGGDWARDRLLPDLARSVYAGTNPIIRNPTSIRPWQHVLDCLNGYLIAIDELLQKKESRAWNFGPNPEDRVTVSEVANKFLSAMHSNLEIQILADSERPEAEILMLDSTRARIDLGWRDKLSTNQAIEWSAEWYSTEKNPKARRACMENQIATFFKL